jgi:hypothetical protein
MKVEIGRIPLRISLDSPAIGDVYRAKGGRGTKFFVVAAITGNIAHALGLNAEGDIVSTTSYGTHVFASRDLVGRVNDLAELTLNIEWEPI